MGLYIIKKGYVTVISPHHDGGLVTFGPGSFFGELSLMFENQSSVVVRSITNCEMWVLYKSEFKRLIWYLPKSVMEQLKTNYFNILKTKDCEYHHSLLVKKPKNFLAIVSNYQRHGEILNIAVKPLLQEAIAANWSAQNLQHQRTIPILFHHDMKFIKAWRYVIAILSIAAFLELLNNRGTHDIHRYTAVGRIMDCLWPNNPYSLTHIPDLRDDETFTKVSMSFSFFLSIVFLADFIISFMTVDKVVFSFISKKELLMKKTTFQNEGVKTLMDAFSIFMTALKIYCVKPIIPYKRGQAYIHILLLFCVLISIILYTVRLTYLFAYQEWTKGNAT